ncbi:hypothetical protein PYW07_016857 [Mythimna separata]|uniref:Endonuclease/exonuclease/phosphatase domain-containing protein n=1 Tax=Mythimna separata TaxID=271217 RepID=A0AAD7YWT6_MYTSE|nr:hypothetical protein PYW07_016857 [Mythimna separata]
MTMLTRSQTEWDIIALTECWLPCTHYIPALDGYTHFQTMNNKSQNEGVVVYYKNTFSISIVEPSITDCNCLSITVNKDTVVLVMYRPPGYRNINNFVLSLDLYIQTLSNFANIILIGDLNIDISDNNSDSNSLCYLNLLASHGMLPAYTIPTHGKTCLDHVFLKTRRLASCYVVETAITDHEAVILIMELSKAITNSRKTIKRINYDKIDVDISNLNFSDIFSATEVNVAVSLFTSKLKKIILDNTQTVKTSNRKRLNKPWITIGLLRCMRNRDNLHRKAKGNPENQVIAETYKRYRNFCNALLKKVKNEYEKTEIESAAKLNNKKLWNAIQNVTRTSKSKNESMKLIDYRNPVSSTNDINRFFASIGKNLAEKCNPIVENYSSPLPPLKYHTQSLVLLPSDPEEIESIILNLKNDCAVGRDGISTAFIKRYRHILIPPITFICNL